MGASKKANRYLASECYPVVDTILSSEFTRSHDLICMESKMEGSAHRRLECRRLQHLLLLCLSCGWRASSCIGQECLIDGDAPYHGVKQPGPVEPAFSLRSLKELTTGSCQAVDRTQSTRKEIAGSPSSFLGH